MTSSRRAPRISLRRHEWPAAARHPASRTVTGHAQRQAAPSLPSVVDDAVRQHGFRRVHTRAALTAMLGGVVAVWLPLLLISGHRSSMPWLIAAVLVAGGAGAVAVHAIVVWALVRIRPQPVAPLARRASAGPVSLTRLILLPGATLITAVAGHIRRPVGRGAPHLGGEHRC